MAEFIQQNTTPNLELKIDDVPWNVVIDEHGNMVPDNCWMPFPESNTLYIGYKLAYNVDMIKRDCWQMYHKHP